MPPPISEDEESDLAAEEVEAPVEKATKKKKASKLSEEKVEDSSDDVDEDADQEEGEEEPAEGEYVVEAIKSHLVDDRGILFQVKWEGYEKRSDMTWEPEESLRGSADQILDEYLESVGGRDRILNEAMNGEEPPKKKKKRGRAPAAIDTPEKPNQKRSRKNSSHPASSTPPASLSNVGFKPPTGSWEDEVQGIDACEGTDGNVMVFLQWASGHKTQHQLDQVYKRCPQKMLKFYEAHLSFAQATETVETLADVQTVSSKKGPGRPPRLRM